MIIESRRELFLRVGKLSASGAALAAATSQARTAQAQAVANCRKGIDFVEPSPVKSAIIEEPVTKETFELTLKDGMGSFRLTRPNPNPEYQLVIYPKEAPHRRTVVNSPCGRAALVRASAINEISTPIPIRTPEPTRTPLPVPTATPGLETRTAPGRPFAWRDLIIPSLAILGAGGAIATALWWCCRKHRHTQQAPEQTPEQSPVAPPPARTPEPPTRATVWAPYTMEAMPNTGTVQAQVIQRPQGPAVEAQLVQPRATEQRQAETITELTQNIGEIDRRTRNIERTLEERLPQRGQQPTP